VGDENEASADDGGGTSGDEFPAGDGEGARCGGGRRRGRSKDWPRAGAEIGSRGRNRVYRTEPEE